MRDELYKYWLVYVHGSDHQPKIVFDPKTAGVALRPPISTGADRPIGFFCFRQIVQYGVALISPFFPSLVQSIVH
jgi:hypothetical protein